MVRDPRVFLWDARKAADAIIKFTNGKTFADYRADAMLRAAVERQLQIVGEALSQLSRIDAALANRVPELRRIIDFRTPLDAGQCIVIATDASCERSGL